MSLLTELGTQPERVRSLVRWDWIETAVQNTQMQYMP